MLTRCLAGLTIYPTASQHATARIRVTPNQRREANPAARKKSLSVFWFGGFRRFRGRCRGGGVPIFESEKWTGHLKSVSDNRALKNSKVSAAEV